jgi:hypothetical protein
MPDPRKVWDPRHFRLDERVLKDVEARPPTFQHISANQYGTVAVPTGEPGGACSCHKKKDSQKQQHKQKQQQQKMAGGGELGSGGNYGDGDSTESEYGDKVLAGCVCGAECENRLLRIECSGGGSGGCGGGGQEPSSSFFPSSVGEGNGGGGVSSNKKSNAATRKDVKWTNCVAGSGCGNRQISLKQGTVKVLPSKEEEMGWGLKLEETVMAGKLVREYVGEVLTEAMLEERMLEHQRFNAIG